MPAIEQRGLEQIAVLWPFKSYNGLGQPTITYPWAPQELNPNRQNGVRWITGQRDMLDPKGNTIVVDVTVISAQIILVDSLMWLGTLAAAQALNGNFVGQANQLMIVKAFKNTPDFRNRNNFYEVGLMRYKDSLPTN